MRGSWKLEVSVSHFSPTCSPEEKADQNCHVQEMKTFLSIISELMNSC